MMTREKKPKKTRKIKQKNQKYKNTKITKKKVVDPSLFSFRPLPPVILICLPRYQFSIRAEVIYIFMRRLTIKLPCLIYIRQISHLPVSFFNTSHLLLSAT